MVRYVVVSVLGGLLFAVMDGAINANPLAQRLYAIYKPLAKPSINVAAGIAIDIVYGFVVAGVFLLLWSSLPGSTGPVKGIGLGLMVWFFRVVMGVAGQWMTLALPGRTLVYTLISGLIEMLVVGLYFGVTLRR